jgi:hypothetical protein
MVEWSGTLSSSAMRTNDRIDRLSLARRAIPRSESIPSNHHTLLARIPVDLSFQLCPIGGELNRVAVFVFDRGP